MKFEGVPEKKGEKMEKLSFFCCSSSDRSNLKEYLRLINWSKIYFGFLKFLIVRITFKLMIVSLTEKVRAWCFTYSNLYVTTSIIWAFLLASFSSGLLWNFKFCKWKVLSFSKALLLVVKTFGHENLNPVAPSIQKLSNTC